MEQAILIRVGIDMSDESGGWNAPCNPDTNDFVYVPIQQTKKPNAPGMERYYSRLIVPALDKFSERNSKCIQLPPRLLKERMHLDPDFENLTYGDTCERGKELLNFKEDDLVIFYAGLRPIKSIKTSGNLVYALIGMLVVKEVVEVKYIDPKRYDENAHTRNAKPELTDRVVRGKTGVSGRFEKCIPIGERRDNAYRVQKPILKSWGDLSTTNGFLQLSGNPPLFKNPSLFAKWLKAQNPKLVQANNP